MIGDILSKLVIDLDHYLCDLDFDHTYIGGIREQITRLRDDADNLRSVLATPPVAIPAADDASHRTGSTQNKTIVQMMMSDETAFDLTTPYFSRSDLLKRGWIKGSIDQLLGKRDWEFPNPHYPGGAPMLCYRQDRVLGAEETPAFSTPVGSSRRTRTA